jgi:hypothetical protein
MGGLLEASTSAPKICLLAGAVAYTKRPEGSTVIELRLGIPKPKWEKPHAPLVGNVASSGTDCAAPFARLPAPE